MKRSVVVLLLLAGLLLAPAAPAAQAPDPLADLRAACRTERSTDAQPVTFRRCDGPITSFDGTQLDATVTLPATVPRGRRLPLVVFLHGLLADKGEYRSASVGGTGPDRGTNAYKTIRWSDAWFASRGYAVLAYSARGHGASGGQIQLASKNVEVRDARRLIGLVADDTRLAPIDARKVAVLGSSYGGGQAWLLMTTREDERLPFGQWRSPTGRLVRLAAVVPQYTWTDLVHALVPNGHQRADRTVDPRTANTPLGVAKVSLIDGFIATAGARLPADAYRWLLRTTAGEPYEGDPVVEEAKTALTRDRSAYFQDGFFAALRSRGQPSIPVLAAQGLTDPIFSPLEVLRMARRLREARPGYPIGMYFGDFEHLTSLVKLKDLGTFHDLGTRFLDHHLRGRGRRGPAPLTRVAVTSCDPGTFGPVLRGASLAALQRGRTTFDLAGSRQSASAVLDPQGATLDPVVVSTQRGRGCLTDARDGTPGIASWSVPITRTATLVGSPLLRFRFSAIATDITFTPRLWDVAPGGGRTLVTRGTWRSVGADAAGGEVVTELFGAAWRFEAGHALQLELPQTDAPFFRPDSFPSAATISDVRLELPTTGP